jgi:hypothetical protein
VATGGLPRLGTPPRPPMRFANRSLPLAARSLSFPLSRESTDAATFSRRLTGRGEVSSPAGGGGGRRPEGVYADITQLLDAEREARQRKKPRRNARQAQAELRRYAQCVNEERLTQTTRQPLFFANRSQPFPLPFEACLLRGLFQRNLRRNLRRHLRHLLPNVPRQALRHGDHPGLAPSCLILFRLARFSE